MVTSHVIRSFTTEPKVVAPATPTSKKDVPTTRKIDDLVISLACKYGTPIGYAQEQSGRLVQNLFPIKSTENKQISSSSKTELFLHTETAFHPYLPDYLILYCVRGDPAAATTYADIADIVEHLSTKAQNILRQPRFVTTVDLSFRTKGEEDQEVLTQIISGTTANPQLKYDASVMRGIDNIAQAALDELTSAIPQCTREVILNTGDALVINNKTTIHGRTPFTPRYDGTDRWIKRVLVRNELPADCVGGVIKTTVFSSPFLPLGMPHRYTDASIQYMHEAYNA
jgi:alpha-ketoglutarate-dependent taurine dioxygenase